MVFFNLKDPNRLYYEPCELMQFENIESQWPIFFVFYLLDGLFRNDKKEVGGQKGQELPPGQGPNPRAGEGGCV